ncbi:hypothetical protein F5X68DRAFT_14322 [Plectosphaerella plurivora]|uniref:Uncharacterized protein n=1 Tax=Plectosphaerella plurivora TaxID=936078 RepID=A0A9P8VBE0_9PEZI|nr:hypothetical protein F5X68DRAFT_14322 [Plectosphaerella plurivora]
MGKAASLKPLIIPAVISLLLFLVSTYILIPIWRRARDRYGQYIPVDTITNNTFSASQRISNHISRFMANPPWRRSEGDMITGGDPMDDGLSDDGEELAHVNPSTRRALNNTAPEPTSRLSRDLEEGFRDDSDDEDDGRRQRR